ncbi:hypothetical protein D3C77_785010 [compost metagenome]
MGAMAQQFAFEQYPGHYLGDFGIGAGLFEQLLDEGSERWHVVVCGLSHFSCLENGTGALDQVTAPICQGTNSFCP